MRGKMWLSLLTMFLCGCATAPINGTFTARIGGINSIGNGTFVRNLVREVQRSTGPVLYYGSCGPTAPQVMPDMQINMLPWQDGIDFYLNEQCEGEAVVTVGNRPPDDGVSSEGHFRIRNTHKGGVRTVVVQVFCPERQNEPWTMVFSVASSGPQIPHS